MGESSGLRCALRMEVQLREGVKDEFLIHAVYPLPQAGVSCPLLLLQRRPWFPLSEEAIGCFKRGGITGSYLTAHGLEEATTLLLKTSSQKREPCISE